MKNNFHFPLRWKEGNTATMTTYNGYTFTVQNAARVLFNDAFAKQQYQQQRGDEFWTCRNFQFGAQMYAKNADK